MPSVEASEAYWYVKLYFLLFIHWFSVSLFWFDAVGFILPMARSKGLVVGGRKVMLIVRTRVLKRSNNVTCALAGFFF